VIPAARHGMTGDGTGRDHGVEMGGSLRAVSLAFHGLGNSENCRSLVQGRNAGCGELLGDRVGEDRLTQLPGRTEEWLGNRERRLR
jgi:hypothetical protein